MKTRTVSSEVTFSYPFVIGNNAEKLPAGTYKLDSDEEKKGRLLFSGYQCVRIVMHLPAQIGDQPENRSLTITPSELNSALKRDERASEPKVASVSSGYTP